MNDITLSETADTKKHNLTSRFIVTGLIAIVFLVSCMTMRGYYILRSTGIEAESHRVAAQISKQVDAATGRVVNIDHRHLTVIGESIRGLEGFGSVALFDTNLKPIWPRRSAPLLNPEELTTAESLIANSFDQVKVREPSYMVVSTWLNGALGRTKALPVFVKLQDRSGNTFALVRVEYSFETILDFARIYGLRVLIFTFFCLLMLFLALYYTFQRGIKTIERQEQKLNKQITRLSKLLSSNKSMQKSMKTASARAVELNEQFLRRVGADLHDGPAQMIGFAVLRLNQVSKQEAATMFGHEFHAVRQALDDSLDEIRGISSGLVLPELEELSLEECLRKVVTLHGAKSKAEIAQFYQELPSDMPLPIKICAYRFIQEALNNAHRHGDAKKCRLSAYVKNHNLVISLKDNGIGFRKSKLKQGGAHLGLVGLKDRVESLGGTFSINSELGVGTALKLTINLADDE